MLADILFGKKNICILQKRTSGSTHILLLMSVFLINGKSNVYSIPTEVDAKNLKIIRLNTK